MNTEEKKLKRKAYQAEYYKKNAEKLKATASEWVKDNPDRRKATRAKYKEEHPERIKASHSKYNKSNPEKRKSQLAKWAKENPEKVNAKTAKRRAIRLNQTPDLNIAEKVEIQFMYLYNKIMPSDWHVDHIVALANGGLHHPTNLQILSKSDNLSKGKRL